MTCVDAIREIYAAETGVLTTSQVIEKIYAKYPDQPWKKSTITAHLMGLSVNHPSSIHYMWTRKHAFLFSLGNGRYRKWNEEQDGTWVVTENGVCLVDDSEDVQIAEDEFGLPVSTSVSLEKDLERSMLGNLEQLEPGLKLYKENELLGHQYDTGVVGRIDILAIDSRENCVVIELKAGEADDRVCGQILRYMGWVKLNLVKDGKIVRGIIVANSFTKRMKYAADALPNIVLKRYEVNFTYYDEELSE